MKQNESRASQGAFYCTDSLTSGKHLVGDSFQKGWWLAHFTGIGPLNCMRPGVREY